jgi:hypothetical protein
MANAIGTLTFHDANGDEWFALEEASVRVIQHSGEVELLFYVSGRTTLDGRRQSTNAEVSVFLQEFKPTDLVGCRFEVPKSYDAEREDHVSCFYLFELRDLNRNVIEVVGRVGKRFEVRWSGSTGNANPGDGESPSRVLIEAAFELSDERVKA